MSYGGASRKIFELKLKQKKEKSKYIYTMTLGPIYIISKYIYTSLKKPNKHETTNNKHVSLGS